MIGSISFEIAIIFILILLNGVFALSEIAVVSSRKTRLRQMADDGDAKAKKALELAESPSDFLSTIQIGITLIGIFTGTFGGATLAIQLDEYFKRIPWLGGFTEELAIALVVLAITYFTLVLGELFPKRLALSRPEEAASRVAGPMSLLSKIAHPAVRVLSVSTEGMAKLFGVASAQEPPVTDEEVGVLIQQGAQFGSFEPIEQQMVEGVLNLNDQTVGELMTPRPDIVWLDVSQSPGELCAEIEEEAHSFYPVARDHLDDFMGVVYAKDLITKSLSGKPINLRKMVKPALFVPESMSPLRLLDLLKKHREHMALVVDEYGNIEGLVTLTDIFESIVGELPHFDEDDRYHIVALGEGAWELDGMLPMIKFEELFSIKFVPESEKLDYRTLGGLIITTLDRIPKTGEEFDLKGLHFEVLETDGPRITKVLVKKTQAGEASPPTETDGTA